MVDYKKDKKIILFGDSVFLGLGATKRDLGCGKLLKYMFLYPVLIKSGNRDTTEDALTRLKKDIITEKCNIKVYVIIMFGNNDCRLIAINKAQVDLASYRNNLKRIVADIRENGMTPLIVNLQPIDDALFLKNLPKIQRDIVIATEAISSETPYTWQKKYSDICFDVAKEEKVVLIDIRTPLEKIVGDIMSSEGTHPNDLGHRIIGERILETVKNLIR